MVVEGVRKIMTDKVSVHTQPHTVYDTVDYIGDYPAHVEMVPGILTLPVPGLKSDKDFKKMRKGKQIKKKITELLKAGKSLITIWKANEIVLYVSEHEVTIKKTFTVLTASASVTACLYLASNRLKRKKKMIS